MVANISPLLCEWPPRKMKGKKNQSHHYDFYPVEHLHAHVIWSMSSSTEINIDLKINYNILIKYNSTGLLGAVRESSTTLLPTQEV